MPTDLSVDACTPARINDCTGDAWWSNLMPSSSACKCAVGEGLGRCSYAPIPQRLARRPTAPHCTAREKGRGLHIFEVYFRLDP